MENFFCVFSANNVFVVLHFIVTIKTECGENPELL